MNTTTQRTLAVVLGLTVGALGLVACSSPGGATSASSSTANGGTEEQDRMRWESDLRACMSKQGFELPEDGQVDFGSRQAEYELASEQCQEEVGPMPGAVTNLSPEQRAAESEAAAVEDECYKDAGFSEGIGDPEAISVPEGAPDDLVDTCTAAGEKARERALDR